MGEEYHLHPTQGQIDTYHQMIEWGADVIFGGHPTSLNQPKRLQKTTKKSIIYSMGKSPFEPTRRNVGKHLDRAWRDYGYHHRKKTEKRLSQALRLIQHGFLVPKSIVVLWEDQLYDYQVFLAKTMPGGPLEHTVDKETLQANSVHLYRSQQTIKY